MPAKYKPMGKEEYRRALALLELTQMGSATFLGVASRTSQAYALGESAVPKGFALLLRIMVKNKLWTTEADQTPIIKIQPGNQTEKMKLFAVSVAALVCGAAHAAELSPAEIARLPQDKSSNKLARRNGKTTFGCVRQWPSKRLSAW